MWAGTSALSNIDQSIQTVRNEVVRLDRQLAQLTQTLAANQRHRVKLINDIAAVRLSELDSGALQHSLNAADKEALQLLEQRDQALDLLNKKIQQLNDSIEKSESERQQLLDEVNRGSQELVDLEASVQEKLKRDDAYLAQFSQASKSESIATEAREKVTRAEQDMQEKAKPYQDDKLFIYLWERGYGTTEYSGGLLARFMDAWVARIIKYEPARQNYWNLTEIPKRLDEHALRVEKVADEEHMALQQLELHALEQGGAVQLESRLDSLRSDLDAHDDVLEDQENELNTKLEERARFISGDDDYIKRCVARLTAALEHQNLSSIHRYVQATASPSDDQIVFELQSIDDALVDVNEDLGDVRSLHTKQINKLKELEQVRHNFKNSRFDDVRSGFANQALIASILSQFLQGVVSGADVWRVLQRNQRYRNVGSSPDFGSGGISGGIGDILGRPGRVGRRSRRRSSWNFPQARRGGGGGGFRFPSGGSSRSNRGGGGFTTGGGF